MIAMFYYRQVPKKAGGLGVSRVRFYIAREVKDEQGVARLTYSDNRKLLLADMVYAKQFVRKHQQIGNIVGDPEYERIS